MWQVIYKPIEIMKKLLFVGITVLFASLLFIEGCEKNDTKGELLFCTNAALLNCLFSIEITIDDTISETITAESIYSSSNCSCPELYCVGLILDIVPGTHTYTAELNCSGYKSVNYWSGNIYIGANKCETIILDVLKNN